MRVLQVIHQFPPFSSQGSEMHCLHLSRALVAGGDDTGVFHISNTARRHPRRLDRGVDEGLRTFHCIDDGHYSRQADWPNHFLRSSFRTAIAEFRPDVVHFHNYLSLGDDLVGIARGAGSAVVYTLHDYGLICPNNLLLRSDGSLCGKNEPDFFADCCPLTIRCSGGRTPLVRHRVPGLFRWRHFAANQPRAVARSVLSACVRAAEAMLGAPERAAVGPKRSFYLGRTRQILEGVHLFIAPGAYLRDRFLQCGVAPDRIVMERNGMRLFPRTPRAPAVDGKVHFGYIGAFHAHKGVAVLLEAFGGLGDRATLHLHGSSFGSPVAEAHFRRITATASRGVVIHGRYHNDEIGTILSGFDALVVPSVWYENSPLTIQEAQIAGVPVITSGAGGMADLVRDGIDGLHFRLGDAADLRRILLVAIEQPAVLEALRRNAPEVPSIERQAARIRGHYDAAMKRARDSSSALRKA